MQRFYATLLFLFISSITLSAQTETPAENCIAIMGDSLPAGTFVAILPGTGVTVLQSERVSHLLDDALQEANLLHYGIYDLSLGASAITDPNAEPYLTSREFFLGRSLNCRYVVIFPFLNDLYISDDGETGIIIYQTGLSFMLENIRQHSPDSNIILMNYYATTLQGAGNATYGEDVSGEHVTAMNNLHLAFCGDDLKITCMALDQFLIPIENYVAGAISQEDYATAGYTLINPDEQTMLDAYWTNTPNNPIYGDGLHLNPDGQAFVVLALMQLFELIDPLNFAPILE